MIGILIPTNKDFMKNFDYINFFYIHLRQFFKKIIN